MLAASKPSQRTLRRLRTSIAKRLVGGESATLHQRNSLVQSTTCVTRATLHEEESQCSMQTEECSDQNQSVSDCEDISDFQAVEQLSELSDTADDGACLQSLFQSEDKILNISVSDNDNGSIDDRSTSSENNGKLYLVTKYLYTPPPPNTDDTWLANLTRYI